MAGTRTTIAVQRSAAPPASESGPDTSPSARTRRILAAIEALPESEREVFSLVRVQGLTHGEAADVLGVSTKTVQRRLNAGLLRLGEQLGDLLAARGQNSGA